MEQNNYQAQPAQPMTKKKRSLTWLKVIVIVAAVIGGLIAAAFVLVRFSSYSSLTEPGYGSDYGALEEKSLTPSAPLALDATEESAEADTVASEEAATAAGEITTEATDQKVIKTGELDLIVKKVDDTLQDITAKATGNGGFIQSSKSERYTDGTKTATVIVRVPADRFEGVLQELKDMAVRVESEEVSGQDVTEEFVDLEAQLKNYQREEEQYLSVLTKAGSIEDILKVHEKLAKTRQNIETTQGRIKYLENLTSFSTITLYLTEEAQVDVVAKEFHPWQTIKEASLSWLGTAQAVIGAIIWLIIYLVPLAVIIWIIVKVIKAIVHRVKRKKEEKAG